MCRLNSKLVRTAAESLRKHPAESALFVIPGLKSHSGQLSQFVKPAGIRQFGAQFIKLAQSPRIRLESQAKFHFSDYGVIHPFEIAVNQFAGSEIPEINQPGPGPSTIQTSL
jgi:hypothetical protein